MSGSMGKMTVSSPNPCKVADRTHMRISFGTLGLCAWLGDREAKRTLDLLNLHCIASSAAVYYIGGCYLIRRQGSEESGVISVGVALKATTTAA
jgi:hypothetical protein